MIVIVATNAECELAQKRFPDDIIIKTGVGALNIIQKLQNASRQMKILNFGYAGSNSIPVGTEVKIGTCQLYHPNVEYDEPIYQLTGDVPCYTSNDFVLKTDIKTPCVFDMELAYILALGFKNVESIKIVSDNLSLEEYQNVESNS